MMRILRRLTAFLLGAMIVLVAAVWVTWNTVPNRTTESTRFDTLIVLGCPANPDGSPSPELRERALEAVREYRAGRAAHMIMSGGAAHNDFVEADVMAGVAKAEGVPADAIEEDRQTRNTIQNIFYSHAIMQQHGWVSAEVISSPNHLPRAALILERWKFPWRTDAAHWPRKYTWMRIVKEDGREAMATAKLRWFGFYATPFLPAQMQKRNQD